MEIHPETARMLKVKDGDCVIIETPEASTRQRAKLTDEIDPRVVRVDSHWWFPEKDTKELSLGGV